MAGALPDRIVARARAESSLTTIRPPPVKRIDLFRPVVVRSPRNGRRSVAAEPRRSRTVAAVFVSQRGAGQMTLHPTPIEAHPSRERRARAQTLAAWKLMRALVSASSWRTTSRARVRYLQARERGSVHRYAKRGRSARGSPIKRGRLHGRGAADRRGEGAQGACRRRDLHELGPGSARLRRVADPRAVRRRYAAMNFSRENTVSRAST